MRDRALHDLQGAGKEESEVMRQNGNTAKKLLAWPMFWLSYYIGHCAFLLVDHNAWPDDIGDGKRLSDRLFDALYGTYQWGMKKSMFWSDWGGLNQWTDAHEQP